MRETVYVKKGKMVDMNVHIKSLALLKALIKGYILSHCLSIAMQIDER
jgi:hypothetical protein